MFRISLWIIVLVGLAFKASAEPYKQVRDWSVWCEYSLTCTLNVDVSAEAIYSLGLQRGPKANAPVVLQLNTAQQLSPNSLVVLQIPDQNTRIELPAATAQSSQSGWTFHDDAIANRLIGAMKAGKIMHLSAVTETGPVEAAISLSGIAAILLFTDEVQGRIDRVDAMYKAGNLPARDAATRVRELINSTEVPNSVLKLWSSGIHECDDDETDVLNSYPGFVVELGDGSALYALPCGLPGAYNLPSIIFRHLSDGNLADRVDLPVMTDAGPGTMSTAYNVYWDDAKSELSAFFKGRGLGDCGSMDTWRWVGEDYEPGFVLVESRFKPDCDGDYDTQWPRIWPPAD